MAGILAECRRSVFNRKAMVKSKVPIALALSAAAAAFAEKPAGAFPTPEAVKAGIEQHS
jgi:hypothetical protein